MKRTTRQQLVVPSVLMALAIILYMIDKQLTIPLNAIWATGGATTLAYFLPVIVLAVFFERRVFFIGLTVLVFALFIVGTSAASILDYGIEYVVPLTVLSLFLNRKAYSDIPKILVFLKLEIALLITFSMYTVAGVVVYGVDIFGSALYNGTLMIFPIIILNVLIIPVLEASSKLIK